MPISFSVHPEHRLVRASFVGPIHLLALAMYARSLADRELLTFGQLIDGRQGTLAMSPEDTRILAKLMATLHARHGRAPIAFVPGDEVSYYVAANYKDLGAGMNPRFAVFPDLAAAELWLGFEAQRAAQKRPERRKRKD